VICKNILTSSFRFLMPATFFALFLLPSLPASAGRHGETYCDEPDFHCVKVGRGQSWQKLWPDEREREIVMKVNRMNIRLRRGMTIAVPDDMEGKTYMDYSPYPHKREPEISSRSRRKSKTWSPNEEAPPLEFAAGDDWESEPFIDRIGSLADEPEFEPDGEKVLIFDPNLLAWAAYDGDGYLVRWGPAVGGKSWCGDTKRSCRTKTGVTRIRNRRGRWARSSKYPLPNGGAAIPYYMGFFPQYGFHASRNVPGRHASHGCIRMFFDDAEWLHNEWVEVGTKAIIRRY